MTDELLSFYFSTPVRDAAARAKLTPTGRCGGLDTRVEVIASTKNALSCSSRCSCGARSISTVSGSAIGDESPRSGDVAPRQRRDTEQSRRDEEAVINETSKRSILARISGAQWLALVLTVLAVLFVVENRNRVDIEFLLITIRSPLWLILLVMFAVGWLVGLFTRHRSNH